MADRFFSGVSLPADWRRRVAGVGLIALGLAGVGIASWQYYDAWATRQSFDASPQAQALARQAAAPTPIRIALATPEPASAQIEPVPTQSPPTPVPATLVAPMLAVPVPTVVVTADQLALDATDFRFLDPPQPGAHARLAISVINHAGAPSGAVLLGIPADWFEDYTIIGTAPAVSRDQTDDFGLRTFTFPPIAAGATVDYELHVTAIGEVTQAPDVKVMLNGGDMIGEASQIATEAPPPNPGPVMSVDIPRLKLHSGVLQVGWEPPPFTVGQIEGSANVTEGNTVLVGHLTGAAGNVFADLDQLEPGDPITAVSRGVSYPFVVSRAFTGANNDPGPIQPEQDDPRLTLMTCAGVWNPFTHDYSERLWVIAEPPDQAAITIANAQATATAQATAGIAATAIAAAAEPSATPVPTLPPPYLGQPSLPGGIGNSRADLEKAFGPATGETSGKLAVFRQPGREFHIQFTPDPQRAAMIVENPSGAITFDNAVKESRKLFPTDTQPRAPSPEGDGQQLVIEQFTSPTLGLALGTDDFSVLYVRDSRGMITSIILGLGDDFGDLLQESRR